MLKGLTWLAEKVSNRAACYKRSNKNTGSRELRTIRYFMDFNIELTVPTYWLKDLYKNLQWKRGSFHGNLSLETKKSIICKLLKEEVHLLYFF